jgi:hypothetical protein
VAETGGNRPERVIGEPSQPPSRRRLRRLGLCGGAALACAVAVVGGLLRHEPAFYRTRIAAALDGEPPPGQSALGRRLVTKISALHADFARSGPWGAAIAEAEVNAWLATDLPRNHAKLLPSGMSSPRVVIGPRRLRVGARVGGATLGGVASIEVEVVLRDVNQIGIVVTDARLGGLPLPRGPVTHEIARRIDALGMATELRRLDGRTLLVVYIPSTHDAGATSYRLESLALEDGEVLVAGVTRAAAPRSGSR